MYLFMGEKKKNSKYVYIFLTRGTTNFPIHRLKFQTYSEKEKDINQNPPTNASPDFNRIKIPRTDHLLITP